MALPDPLSEAKQHTTQLHWPAAVTSIAVEPGLQFVDFLVWLGTAQIFATCVKLSVNQSEGAAVWVASNNLNKFCLCNVLGSGTECRETTHHSTTKQLRQALLYDDTSSLLDGFCPHTSHCSPERSTCCWSSP
eukprot:3692493-Amphidinium_carterae.1